MLAAVFGSSFDKPPRSDYWTAFYYFHQAAASPAPAAWLSLCNYDPWRHGTFRPVSHLLLYLEFRVFKTWFVGNRLVNFTMYFSSILLLFLLARQFGLNSALTLALLWVYAFLYSHFDIVTWTFQIFSTSSFCAFLLGFIVYARFLKTGKGLLLIPMGLLFLYAMLCSEVYAFWPLAVLILALGVKRLFPEARPDRKRLLKLSGGVLFLIYLAYAGLFAATRGAANSTGPLPHPGAGQILTAVAGPFFNLAYNGILVNLLPFVSEPAVIFYNIDMGGLLIRWYDHLAAIITWGGLAVFLVLVLLAARLYLRKRFRPLLLMSFLLFLYFTNLFVVTFSRLTTNEYRYVFTQFRYQYIPNALLALMLAVALGEFVRPRLKSLLALVAVLLPILALNLYYSHKYISFISGQLEPLGLMLENIRSEISAGRISAQEPLYIDRRVTESLPELCWNEDMARFMGGTYQWFFPPAWMPCFTFSFEKASWLIGPDNPAQIHRIKP